MIAVLGDSGEFVSPEQVTLGMMACWNQGILGDGEIDGVTLVDVVASRTDGEAEIRVREARVFVDSGGHLAEVYGGRGEFMLVRPDGYVGWIGMAGDLGDLNRYLEWGMG